ncbi:FMN-dependent NADH-azoreductase [Enterococcus alishanensis]|uniref:FMN dependent NADH:quinone oxidoreductase n=1 Tax=Enterococcus alishanensis TaxID=1303817 RepID=A0ABS6T941_9ENTE|nr:NAD(P)H-dependent oxidoreductase [Enterococcus alishanensis]MBV7389415.1 NAD(P)H-dependent oxidoreductase [Enterococcus alishanensis]
MSNVLVIKAHPLTKDESQSVAVLDTFLTEYEAKNPSDVIEVVDLYDTNLPEIDKDILLGWRALQAGADFTSLSATQQEKIATFNSFTEQFLAADKIVIANGMWNLNIPTRLKAWFDTVNVAGKTFKYTAEGPVGLVENKKALHIQSSGGVYGGEDFSSSYIKHILAFIGVTDFEAIYIEGADYNPDDREAIMAAAKDAAKQLADSF